jgi:hypothetical protein
VVIKNPDEIYKNLQPKKDNIIEIIEGEPIYCRVHLKNAEAPAKFKISYNTYGDLKTYVSKIHPKPKGAG